MVDHFVLMSKMSRLGLPNFLIRWLTNFLTGRKMRTKLGTVESPWASVNAGVPQGTLLGPVCFIFHINDLQTSAHMVKYVDDSTLWSVGSSGVDDLLQRSAQEAETWATDTLMSLNSDKTKDMVVCFMRKRPPVPAITLGGCEIERVSQIKLLGVIIADDLKWQGHVNYVAGKGSSRLYFLRMLRRAGVDPKDIVAIYVALIRSVLEYACQVWHTALTVQQSDQLEQVQRSALRVAYPHHSYREALQITRLDTLHDR